MLPSRERLKQQWGERWRTFRDAPPGLRFEQHYAQQRLRDEHKHKALLLLRALLAVLAFAIGVVLAFIPGPAVVFFALAAMIFSSHSLRLARVLDQGELRARKRWRRIRARCLRLRSHYRRARAKHRRS